MAKNDNQDNNQDNQDNQDLEPLIRAGAEPFADEGDDSPGDRGDSVEASAEAPTSPPAEAPAEAPTEAPAPAAAAKPTDEGGKTETPAAEPQQDDQQDDQRGPKWMPKARFDEVNERRKAAEAKLAEIEQRQQAAQQADEGTFDFDAKEKEHAEAVLDGDVDKAIAIRKEIREAEQALYEKRSHASSDQVRQQAIAEIKAQETIDELTRAYSVFDPDSESYDQDITDEALALSEAFQTRQNLSFDSAIRKAVNYVAKQHDLKPTEAAAPAEGLNGQPGKNESGKPSREATQAKVDEVTSGQPPQHTANRREEAGERAISDLSDEELDALPIATLQRMRGDFVSGAA